MQKKINNVDYRVVLVITVLTFGLSLAITAVNYYNSVNKTHDELIRRSLPLTVDNVYTEVQKNIIEPNLISSMMSNDTFLKSWLKKDEKNRQDIEMYLSTLQEKYDIFTTFLVSENTKHYYNQNGFVEVIQPTKEYNRWYFNFKRSSSDVEVNIDYNNNLGSSLVMFINYKIYDEANQLLGATGVGLKTSYINDMLKQLRESYNFNVYFVNKSGNVVISEYNFPRIQNIAEIPELKALQPELIGVGSKLFEYSYQGSRYLINRKYIEELDLYLLVEAELDDFTEGVTKIFYLNILVSFGITALVTFVILAYVRGYNKKLSYLATHDVLTGLANRSFLHDKINKYFLKQSLRPDAKKNENKTFNSSLIFLDIDDFKSVNDTFGHDVGDKVIQRVAEIIEASIRHSDLAARWGGEEFAVGLFRISLPETQKVAEELRQKIASDQQLNNLVKHSVTASFGVSMLMKNDTIETLFTRADNALYQAKSSGKNQVVIG